MITLLTIKHMLESWWGIVVSYGVAGIAVIGLLAVALFAPLGPRARLAAFAAAALIVALTASYTVGLKQGADRVKRDWDWTLQVEAKDGEEARTDAERTVPAEPPASVRDDIWNRDGWKDGKRP